MPPPLSASGIATRFTAHWVIDALAADQTLDFSIIKALVVAFSGCLAGAPAATRERVALRCLQEVASIAPEGDAAATARVLRVGGTRSCEDVLLGLIEEVGRSGNLEKDMLLPFSQDIQKIICIKKPSLPDISFELLKEVDTEIASLAPPSQLEQNGTSQCDVDQSLGSGHDHVNIEKPSSGANSGLQQENSENLVDETDARNVPKDPIAPPSVLHQPCTSNSSYNHVQEDAVGLGARSPERSPIVEGNISAGAMPDSVSCDAALQGSIAEPMSNHDKEVHTAMVQPQSRREKSPNPPHSINIERPNDGGANDHSPKDPRHGGLSKHSTVTSASDRSGDALPKNVSEPRHLPEFSTAQDATLVSPSHNSKTSPSALQHRSGEKGNQDPDDVSANIQPVEKDHVHEELNVQTADALHSVGCNGATQGGKSDANHPPGNATEHSMVSEKQNVDKSHLEASGADKVNQALHDGIVLEKSTVHIGLNAQTATTPENCNIAVHEQNHGKNRSDVPKCCSTSVPNPAQDGDSVMGRPQAGGKRTAKTSNKNNVGVTFAETSHAPSSEDRFHAAAAAAGLLSMTNKMPFCTRDEEANDILEDLSQQDLCIKCGKDGQLLKCSCCLLSAHDSCFGSSATFEETNLFYCPVCIFTKATQAYQKAKKEYCEARKNLAAFLGTTLIVKEHNEQLTGVLPRDSNKDGQLNGCDSSKRKHIHQNEADDLVHCGEGLDQQRKKQKINSTSSSFPEVVRTEKAPPFQNSDVAPTNKHSVRQNSNSKGNQDAEKQQQAESLQTRKEAGNGNLSHETGSSSQNRCGPSANQEVEADKEDVPTNSHQSDDSDEIEATSSNDSGKRSSPPWRNMRHSKARLQERKAAGSNASKKTMAQQDQHMPSPSSKKSYAYPQKRYSNPLAAPGRRIPLCWTEEEEEFLREAVAKFTTEEDIPIPWVRILEYGRNVFHGTRLPPDLRVKWRNMKKKEAKY